jgi:putative endopeptidase
MVTKQKGWGFNTKELDSEIRPQDDFYQYVNKKWMEKNPIPKNEGRWGTFMVLRYDSDKQVKALLDTVEKMRSVKKGSPEQLIRDFYRSGMNMKQRNAAGIAPLKPLLSRIEKVTSKEQLPTLIAELHRIGATGFFGTGIEQDAKNSEKYAFHLGQDGLGLPDRDYYLKDDAESLRVRNAYRTHVQKMLQLTGRTAKESEAMTEVILSIETKLAAASMKKEDMRDPEKVYHKMSPKQFAKLAPNFDWGTYFAKTGVEKLPYVIVLQPSFFTATDTLIAKTALEDIQTYLTWHLVNDYAGALSERFIKQSFSFYGTVLSGITVMQPLWRRVLSTVNGGLGELIGKMYVEKHFSKESKKKMELLVTDLFTAYEARIRGLEWMTPATKRKALQKLNALTRKIGYPDKWKSYAGLVITPDDYMANIMRMNEFEHKRLLKKLREPLDRSEWFMHPQTVNAYFAPNLNDIVFPAAILQPPFFDLNADDAINYGSIGAVIGHEISHGFDDEGSKYDAKGNLKSWWTAEDRKRFEKKAKKIEKLFNTFTVEDGLKVNGKLTLGENIADFAGLSIAFDAYQLQLARTGRNDIEGLTPEQRFFISFAVFERENARPEVTKKRVLTDPHSPGHFRINAPISNFDHFYTAFDVKKGDKHYRSPAEREMVW